MLGREVLEYLLKLQMPQICIPATQCSFRLSNFFGTLNFLNIYLKVFKILMWIYNYINALYHTKNTCDKIYLRMRMQPHLKNTFWCKKKILFFESTLKIKLILGGSFFLILLILVINIESYGISSN